MSRKVFEILLAHPDGLPAQAVLKCIEQSFPLTDFERSFNPADPCLKRFEQIAQFGTIAPVKAGWLSQDNGRWSITEQGRRAYARFQDPEEFMREAGRLSVRGWLSVHSPRFYSYLGDLKERVGMECRMVRRIGFRPLLEIGIGTTSPWQKNYPMQSPLRFNVDGPAFREIDEMLDYLRSIGASYSRGGHTVYIPPSSAEKSAFRSLMRNYPPNAGIKIVSNPGGVDDSTYINGARKKISTIHKKLTNNHRYLTLVANLLFQEGMCPRLYDLIELRCGEQLWTAYIIEHVEGRTPTASECEAGIAKFRHLERQGLIKVSLPNGYEEEDFQCPACNKNAFIDDRGEFLYIDFQNFLIPNYRSFLNTIASKAAEELPSDGESLMFVNDLVPGMRSTGSQSAGERISVMQRLMESAGLSVKNRLVLDVGSNVATMAWFLKLGARWCHGLGRADAQAHVGRMLLALGCTRFSTSARENDRTIQGKAELPDFLKPLLEDCIISYTASRPGSGWMDTIAQIPWSFLIYDGGASDTEGGFQDCLVKLKSRVSFKVAAQGRYRDGSGNSHTLAILQSDRS